MMDTRSIDFNWEELLRRIKRGSVIPVTGQCLYRVLDMKRNEHRLYDFLAEQLAKEIKFELPKDSNHKFAKACLEFLEKKGNNYLDLSDFIAEILKGTILIPKSPLWKLARVKPFNTFITTAYDNFLSDTLIGVRGIDNLESLYYTKNEKNLGDLSTELFNELKKGQKTLIYHFFGHMAVNNEPAYTDSDILETIFEFQKDLVRRQDNKISSKLKNDDLLFMGCGYDDWLFRFFIRTMANEPFKFISDSQKRKFVGDSIHKNFKDPHLDLPKFLKKHRSEVFFCGGEDFVDLLVQKLEKNQPDSIISPDDFPGTVFISFHGSDRAIAAKMAYNLRKEGIAAWLDERAFQPGDDIDETILKAIDRCPVFVPLCSKNSMRLTDKDGNPNYHYKEWIAAWSRKDKIKIMPVQIDDSGWMYEDFKDLFYIKIPNGERVGDYEKLKNKLSAFQQGGGG